MPLQISEFGDVAYVRGSVAQLPDGVPKNVVNLNAGQSHTVTAGTRIVRIAPVGGSFNVTWPGPFTERFDAPEYRAIEAGVIISAASV